MGVCAAWRRSWEGAPRPPPTPPHTGWGGKGEGSAAQNEGGGIVLEELSMKPLEERLGLGLHPSQDTYRLGGCRQVTQSLYSLGFICKLKI